MLLTFSLFIVANSVSRRLTSLKADLKILNLKILLI
nr:MAG TPA: hypothetical protein [Crassvirales sp.]